MSYLPLSADYKLKPTSFKNSHSSIFQKSSAAPKSSRRNSTARNESPESNPPLLVHCHLGWDWVWQRPQQFVSRLSKRHKTLFVEMLAPDPQLAVATARFRPVEDFANLTVLSLQFPAWRWSDGAYVDAERRRLVKEFLTGPGAGQFENPIQWFYDPMAVPAFVGEMGEVLTVYDCMDELSKFAGAPPQILERERQLLARADLVFTGGHKLFQLKSRSNPNCHFFGCGVDVEHFSQARVAATKVPDELQQLPKPLFGYFGVIDERLDYELLANLADANSTGSIVMIGPVLKVDQRQLPQRPNLHWLGPRPYAALPGFCKAFDVCLMPFALNEATEYINPTKALEYMATGREIVSTAVADVIHNFSSVVKVAASRQEFVDQCLRAAKAPDAPAISRGLEMVRHNSWDAIVEKLEEHLETVLDRNRSGTRQERTGTEAIADVGDRL